MNLELIEFVATQDAQYEDGLIKNVIVLGPVSKNKRRYLPGAMKNAISLYEGMAVSVNHPQKKGQLRQAEERFGTLEGVRFVEAENRLRGDLRHLTTHPMAPRVKEDLAKGLHLFGLSHEADGEGRKEGDIEVVEAITKVNGVSLVTSPATCRSLMEQDGQASPDLAQASMDAMTQQVMAVIADTSLDIPGKLEKIKLILEANEQLAGDLGADGEGAAAPAEQIEAQVSRLVEAELKKQLAKKYTRPAYTPTARAIHATEQTIPEDPKELARWLRRKD